jgi:uncharacterized integral membrane protein
MTGKYIVVIIFLILLVLFLILNSGATRVNYIFGTATVSTAILIFVSAIIGFVIGSAITYRVGKTSKPQKNAKKV